MIIAQISDTHILARSSDQGASRAENLRHCVADINRQGVDAVIHTGDSVHQAEPDEYAHLREILAGLQAPLFLVPGNRDRREALSAAFGNLPYLLQTGEYLHYAVENCPVRLIGLDSTAAGERKGVFGADRQAWLETKRWPKSPKDPPYSSFIIRLSISRSIMWADTGISRMPTVWP